MEKKTFVKKLAIYVAIVAALIVAALGLFGGKVIEETLFGEVTKWVVMGLVIVGILEGFVYFLGPLIWHFTYGKTKDEEK